jgi:N-methylhydantoinase B
LIARGGRVDDDRLAALIEPMRNQRERRADLLAQLAANRLGARRIERLVERRSAATIRDGMAAVLDYAERATRAAIERLPDGSYRASDVLEDDVLEGPSDIEIAATVTVDGDGLTVDFGGTAPQTSGNLNCPLSVTTSAVYFVVRVLTEPDIPSCAGAYRPIEVAAPAGCLVNALPPAAVAGGNVETSSRIADVVLLALGRAADQPALGQGTMNNLTLGNRDFAYYETLGGGQGACADANGPSAVHVTMSNTLNTPIEALENEFPLRVTEYAVRRGSAGGGEHRGGDGLIREIEALEPVEYSLLTERRRHSPRGTLGGEPGSPGRNLVLDATSAERVLPGKARGQLAAGERLRIETPGGGGRGSGAPEPL